MYKWHKYPEDKPKANGDYLCASLKFSGKHITKDVLTWANNLENADNYCFHGKNRGGWYYYDSEYGYIEDLYVGYWMELPKCPEECGGVK